MSVLDRTVSGERSVFVMATSDTNMTALGQTAAGTLLVLCR